MAETAKQWRLEDHYPPMLWVDFLPLRTRVVAEWLHCAGLTCGEYELSHIADRIEAIVLSELRGTADRPWGAVLDMTQKEDD